MNILEEANAIIHGARRQAYGSPLDNHGLTARYWQVYLSSGIKEVKAEDVCMLNILQKIARFQNAVDLNRDSLVDIAGYAGNIEMIINQRKEHTMDDEKTSGETTPATPTESAS